MADIELQDYRLFDYAVGYLHIANRRTTDQRAAPLEQQRAAVIGSPMVQSQPRRPTLLGVEPAIQAAGQYAFAVAQLAGFDHNGRINLHGHVTRLALGSPNLDDRQFNFIDGTRRTQRTAKTHCHVTLPTGGQVNAQQSRVIFFGNGPMVVARGHNLLEFQIVWQISLHTKDRAALDVQQQPRFQRSRVLAEREDALHIGRDSRFRGARRKAHFERRGRETVSLERTNAQGLVLVVDQTGELGRPVTQVGTFHAAGVGGAKFQQGAMANGDLALVQSSIGNRNGRDVELGQRTVAHRAAFREPQYNRLAFFGRAKQHHVDQMAAFIAPRLPTANIAALDLFDKIISGHIDRELLALAAGEIELQSPKHPQTVLFDVEQAHACGGKAAVDLTFGNLGPPLDVQHSAAAGRERSQRGCDGFVRLLGLVTLTVGYPTNVQLGLRRGHRDCERSGGRVGKATEDNSPATLPRYGHSGRQFQSVATFALDVQGCYRTAGPSLG